MRYAIFSFFIVLFSCENRQPKTKQYKPMKDSIYYKAIPDTLLIAVPKQLDSVELRMIAMGLVKINSVDSTIRVNLRYSSTKNFFGVDVYETMTDAYLQPDVADKLSKAQQILHAQYPNYSLLIYDAARPMFVQQLMWDTVKIPVKEKTKYLSNPKKGSLHNYGAAVDITICDSMGVPLDMGTDFDYFGELAYPSREQALLRDGSITLEQINNRKLLRSVMTSAGFFNIQTEWWHFNSCNRYEAEKKYKLIK